MGEVGDGRQTARLNVGFTEKMLYGLGKIQEELKLRCCWQITEKQQEDLKKSLERFNLVEIPAINTDNTIITIVLKPLGQILDKLWVLSAVW